MDAREFAIRAHGNQKYGDKPYSAHLDDVAKLAKPYGEKAVIIAYLHDVVEDTPVSVGDITIEFGAHIAVCVGYLTDMPGANRRERKAKTYARMAHIAASDGSSLALIVKTCDRLANVRTCLREPNRRLYETYQREHKAFRKAAYRKGLCDELWAELDNLMSL